MISCKRTDSQMRILVSIIAIFLSVFTSSCGQLHSRQKIFGIVQIKGLGGDVGCAGEPVYLFSRDQIDELIFELTREYSRRPTAQEVFAKLPLTKCLAKTETELYGSRFKMKVRLDRNNNFVLAVDAHKHRHYFNVNGKITWADSNCYWLYPFRLESSAQPIVIHLNEGNTVSSSFPGVIPLVVSRTDTNRDQPH